jgi:hypothetical protein
LKKCPRCNSISSDAENLCGVCGGSLNHAASEDLEQLVHNPPPPEVTPNRKLNLGALALIILALLMTVGGLALLLLQNALGLILLLAGLFSTLPIVGGVGGHSRSGGRGGAAMLREELREKEKERKRDTGEED